MSSALLLALALVAQDGADEPRARAFRDPSPPSVAELAPLAAPAARATDELTFHAAPKPLARDAVTEDWPGFFGPRRDGHVRETRLALDFPPEGPPLVWEVERGEGYASPVIAGERLVHTHRIGNELHLDCLDAETGRRFWRYTLPCDYSPRYITNGGPRATPAIAGEHVFWHALEGQLLCLELATGRVVWQRDLARELDTQPDFFGVVSSPLVVGELVVQMIGAPRGPGVAAFDRATGKLVWGAGDDWGASCSSPVLARVHGRERLFVLAGGESRPPTGGLWVIDPTDGAIELELPFRSRIYESATASLPLVADERVMLTSSYGVGTLMLALAEDGSARELWRRRDFGLQFSNAVAHAGEIWALDGRSDRAGAVVCLDAATGEELARMDVELRETVADGGKERELSLSIGEGSLLLVEGGLLCLGDNGHLLRIGIGAEGPRIQARAWLFGANETWTPPAVSRGLLYVCQNNRARFGDTPRRLLCYDVRAG